MTERPPTPPQPTAEAAGDRRSQASPGLALVLSVLPGLGHVYLGLYARGAMVFLAFLVAVTLANHAGELGFVAVFLWFFGLVDAYRQGRILNTVDFVEPVPANNRGAGSLGLGVFLVIVGGILLLDKFVDIDLDWLADWWPAILVAAGVYFIAAALKERREAREDEIDQMLDVGDEDES